MLAYALMLQTVSGPGLTTPAPLRATRDCGAPSTGPAGPVPDAPIVVCGTPQATFRLKPLPETFERPTLPKAEIGLVGKARLAAEAEQGTLAGGQTSKRAMIRLKMPF